MVGVLVADEPKSETPGLEAATVNNGIFRIILFINQFTALEMQKETISLIEKAKYFIFLDNILQMRPLCTSGG